MMADRNLLDRKARCPGASQDLGVHESADRFDRDRIEHLAPEDLEGAIDVAHGKAEECTNDPAPYASDDPSYPRIPARGSISSNDVEFLGVFEQAPNLAEIELEIGVAEEDEFTARFAKARSESRPIPAIGGVMYGADAWIPCARDGEEFLAAILRAVIDDDDLEIEIEALADRGRTLEQRRQILRLVERRKDKRDFRIIHSRTSRVRRTFSRIAYSMWSFATASFFPTSHRRSMGPGMPEPRLDHRCGQPRADPIEVDSAWSIDFFPVGKGSRRVELLGFGADEPPRVTPARWVQKEDRR